MRTVTAQALRQSEVGFSDIEIFPESWIKRSGFFAYEDQPRPLSAVFFVCTDIRVTFCPINGERVTAGRGDVVFIPAGLCYRVLVEGGTRGKTDTYTVNFRMTDIDGEELLLSETVTIIAKLPVELFEIRCEKLNGSLHRIDGECADCISIKADFYSLIDTAVLCEPENSEEYYPIRVGVEAIKREWNKNEKIEKYAELCGISPAYFYRCFKKWCQKSPVEYRNSIRLSNAEAMLRSTDMRVNEISEMIGYEDPFYFCRVFTAKNGISPRKYRRVFRNSEKI